MKNLLRQPTLCDAERLALYREQLLPEQERRIIKSRLENDAALQELDRQLRCTDAALQEWGRYHRIRKAVLQANHEPAFQEASGVSPSKSPSFFQPIVAAATFVLAIFGAFMLLNVSPPDRFQVLDLRGDVIVADASTQEHGAIRHINVPENGLLEIQMGDGRSKVCFNEDTIAEIRGGRELFLEKGSTLHRVAANDRIPYRVLTPHGVVTVLGTEFEVVVNPVETKVNVDKGRVKLRAWLNDEPTDNVQELLSRQSATMQAGSVSSPVPAQERVAPWAPSTKREFTPRDIHNVITR